MLTARQNKAIELLLQGKSKGEAAKEVGISVRQIYNYFQSNEFAEMLRQRQGELVTQAAAIGRSRTAAAMRLFEEIMTDETQNGQIRVSAARNLLQFALELDERENILTRIEQLEKSIGGEHE